MNKRELTAAVEDLQAWRRSMEPAVTMDEAAEVLLAEAAPTAAERLRAATYQLDGETDAEYADRLAEMLCRLANMPSVTPGKVEDYRYDIGYNAGIIAAQKAALAAIEVPGEQPEGGNDGQ